MVILKCTAGSLKGILESHKYASSSQRLLSPGEIILIQQTVKSLTRKTEKTIRWIMNYVEIYEDFNNESDTIWRKHWKYIIRGENLRYVDGFNIKDLQVTNHNYKQVPVCVKLKELDEIEVINWLGETNLIENQVIENPEELKLIQGKTGDEIISILNLKYAGKPTYKTYMSTSINRPSALRDAIIARDGTTCKICKTEGFLKKSGDQYCELHHMIELNNKAPESLQSWNIIVLCPTCHRKFHYGNVKSEYLNPGWKIIIDNKEHLITE